MAEILRMRVDHPLSVDSSMFRRMKGDVVHIINGSDHGIGIVNAGVVHPDFEIIKVPGDRSEFLDFILKPLSDVDAEGEGGYEMARKKFTLDETLLPVAKQTELTNKRIVEVTKAELTATKVAPKNMTQRVPMRVVGSVKASVTRVGVA